jgi:hypothetical protein
MDRVEFHNYEDIQTKFKIKWKKVRKGWELHFAPASYPGHGHPIWIVRKTKINCLLALVDMLNEYSQNWHYTRRMVEPLIDKSFF